MKVQQIADFKARHPLGAIRTIQYDGKCVTGAITSYRCSIKGVMMFGIYDEGYTYYSTGTV